MLTQMLDSLLSTWREPSPTAARLFLFTGAALWSSGGLFIKEIDAGAMSIVFFRCFFSVLLLAAFMGGRRLPGRKDAVVSIGLFAALLVTFVASTKETTAANAIFLQYTAPLYVVAFGPLILGESLQRRDGPPMAIALLGIVVLFAGNQGSGDVLGLWLGVASGAFFGLMFLWLRRMNYADPIAITFMNCAGAAVLTVAFASVWDIEAGALGVLALMALVQFATAYVLFTKGIAHVRSSEASLIALVEPVLNPVWVALFFGEEPSTATIIGGAIILAGLGLRYSIFRGAERDAPPAAVDEDSPPIMDSGTAPSEDNPGSR
jgi:drug/metabolite transporter (DMT)-like permease